MPANQSASGDGVGNRNPRGSRTNSNALQAASFWVRALGFKETAYAGLETGVRDRASHVLEQGRIRIVLTGALTP